MVFLSCKKEHSSEGCIGNNKLPIAIAGSDTAITLPLDRLMLDGSKSSDPDGRISEWHWTKISGPASSAITYPSDSVIVVKSLTAGTYLFELKVTDNDGLSAKDTVQVTVQPAQQAVCDPLNRATITIQLIPFASFPTPRYGITTATAGNKLLLAGGITDPGGYPPDWVSDVDIYDFGAQTWSTAHLSTARGSMSVATAGNKIFFVGGTGPNFYGTTLVDIYDASTNTWSLSDLPSPASVVFSYAVAGNKVFFATGTPWGGKVDVYDTSISLWSEIDLPEQVQFVTATTVGNKVYFAGGLANPPANNLSNVVEIYDNTTGTWSTTSSLSQPTEAMASIYVNEKIYWAGGVISNDFVNDRSVITCKVEIRDVSTGSSLFTNLSKPRDFDGNSKPIYYNSKIIFWSPWGYYLDIYDPQSSTWSIGQFPQNVFIESVILVNNALYAIGGYNDSSGLQLTNQIWKLQY